jgi:carboxypeptidase family protein
MKIFRAFLNPISQWSGRICLSILTSCLIFAVASSLHAQALSGIQGTVTDQSGAVVPEAKVTVTNTATGVVSTATTSSVGTFTITDLIPGTYQVRIEKAGFQTSVIKGINVEAGAKLASADAVLKTGTATETMEVLAQAITLETSQPDFGTVVESKLIEELPIMMGANSGAGGRGRQIDNFLFLTPGVQGSNFEHRINGGVSFQNEVVFNGIDANQSETQGFQSNINPPYEMVSEFRLLSTVFSAQYGLAQGVAYYQFASGTNTLHGDVFEIMRNDYFDARGAVNPTVPVDKEHNFGFSLGGPVFVPKVYHGRNKTFFHVSSEWYRLNQGIAATMTVPTGPMKQGDFSGLVDPSGKLIPIYVPGKISAACQAALPTGVGPGNPFPGNKIPSGCISAISTSLIPLIPDPDVAGANFTGNKQSQLTNIPTRQTSWGFSIDHDLTDRQKLHGSFWRDTYNTPAFDSGAFFNNALSALKNEPRIGTGLFLTYSKTFSPSLVMTAGLGWMGEINDEHNAHEGFKFAGAAGSEILPTIAFGGPAPYALTPWGVNGNGETFSINRKLGLSFDNNWLYTRGRHSINLGLEVRRSYQDDHECQNCGGRFFFSSRMTSNGDNNSGDPINVNNSGNAFASFLVGEPNSAFRQFALETKLRNLYFAPYVQDNIKVSSRLTVDVGVRWDILKPFTVDSVAGQPPKTIVFFDPTAFNPGAISNNTGQPLLGAANLLGACLGCSGYNSANTRWRNFSPRLGFAYKLNNKTVILSGFALNHLDTGAYEYGNNKVAVNYGSLLAGIFNVNGNTANVAGYCAPPFGNGPSSDCTWDSAPMPVPAAKPFSATLANGTGVLHQFARDPGPIGYVQQWNFGVQRELGFNTLVTASYVGNRAIHLPSMMNPINQLDPKFLTQFCPTANPSDASCTLEAQWNSPAGQSALQVVGFGKDANGFFSPYANFGNDYPSAVAFQALLPFPMYNSSGSCGGICNNFDMTGSSFYSALQVQAEKRFEGGLAFLVAYTLSRTMSNTDSGFSTFNFGSLNRFNQKSEWSIASNDQTYLLKISPVYELPIGPGKKFLNRGGMLAKNLLSGWQFSGVFQYDSGTPGTIFANDNDPLGNGFNRANYNPSVPLNVNWNNYYKGLPIFNTAAFSDPGFTPGNEPRNIGTLRSPTFGQEDFALAKKFYFGERVSAELRMEFYNVLNRMLVCTPDTSVNDSTFGLINGGGASFSPCQANAPRRGQAYFKISF